MAQDARGTLARIADLGIKWVELAGTNGLSNEEFGAALKSAGLSACSAHVGLETLEGNPEEAVALAKAVGATHLALPWIDKAAHPDPEEFAGRVNAIGIRLREDGIALAYHNHAFELEGSEPLWLDRLFSATNPALVKAQLDLGWVQVAGYEPVDYIERYAGRLPTVHLKDYSGDAKAHDAIAGEGWLDWDSILSACENAGVAFGIIEMDLPPGDALESVGKCAEFFRSKGLS